MNVHFSGSAHLATEIVVAARKVADQAEADGVGSGFASGRRSCHHLGAVLADCVLQAGLNYRSVVFPRVRRILDFYPHAAAMDALLDIVKSGKSAEFLNWQHPTKTARFERLVLSIHGVGIIDTRTLRGMLEDPGFSDHLQSINGIGPKTVDYMACLVGIDSIAVDRHIRAFAQRAGIDTPDYYQLKWIFCCAADLLAVPRRDFDAWVWHRESQAKSMQMMLDF